MSAEAALRSEVLTSVEKMIRSYGQLVASAKISEDAARADADGLRTAVHAASLVSAGEAVLRLTADLKTTAVLHDFEATNAAIAETTAQLEGAAGAQRDAMQQTLVEVSLALVELETHLAASRSWPSS